MEQIFVFVFNNLIRCKRYLLLLITCLLLSSGISIFLNIVNQMTFDEVFYRKNLQFLFDRMIYLILGIFVLLLLLGLAAKMLMLKLYGKSALNLRLFFYEKLVKSDFLFLNGKTSADIYYRMFQDLGAVQKYILDLLTTVPVKLLYFAGCVWILFHWSPALTFAFLGLMLINVICILATRKYMKTIYTLQRKLEQQLLSKINEDFDNIALIKSYGIEDIKKGNMLNELTRFMNIDIKNSFILSLLGIVNGLSVNIWGIVSVIMGATFVYSDALTVGQFISFTAMANVLAGIVSGILEFVFLLPPALVSFQRVNEYLDHYDERGYRGHEKFSFAGRFEMRDVNFRYPTMHRDLLKHISIICVPGEVLSIAGENGRGKTTLQNLIARLIVGEHDIKIDGVPIMDIDVSEFRKNISYLYQDTKIYKDTIINNITLGRDEIDMDLVNALAGVLKFDQFVSVLPQGMDTVIGGEGWQLSLGNRQKLGIIRTFACRPRIILLDEPTANLDVASKRNFLIMLQAYKQDYDALIIVSSHEEEVLKLADRNIVI